MQQTQAEQVTKRVESANMSHERPECASKLKAIKEMADELDQASASPKAEENRQLTIRLPKTDSKQLSSTNRKAGQKRKHTSMPDNEPVPKMSRRPPRPCKVKLWRFQYTGPGRGGDGETVTLQEPCLRVTCASCWRWHPHLMGGLFEPDTGFDGAVEQVISPRSPVVSDPTSIDGGGSEVQKGVTRLVLSSEEGKARFRALVHEQSKQWSSSGDDGSHAVREELRDEQSGSGSGSGSGSDGDARRPRRRHRVKLAFKSEQGKGDYKRLVERYLS